MKLFLLTGPEYPKGHPDDQKLFHKCADRLGATHVHWRNWREGAVFGDAGDKVLVRTPWDYQSDARLFLQTMKDIEGRGLQLFNPYATIAWNLDKKYLLELAGRGVPIVPTLQLEGANPASIAKFIADCPLPANEWIVKPRVGASASGIRKLANVARLAAELQSLPHREFLLQPMVDSVRLQGEVSLLYYRVDGNTTYSHASLKLPKAGDFRVQTDWGGSDQAYSPKPELVAAGAAWLSQMQKAWSYARVDILDFEKSPGLLGEIEFIEPQLFHRFGDASEELLMRAIGISI